MFDGDEVCAFDVVSGAPIINTIENVDLFDYWEWCRRWENVAVEAVPDFVWYRINGKHLLFGQQSVWRNDTNVCHVKDLVFGDVIYDDADHDVVVISIEEVVDNSLVWYRFDISGDHSYIVDGITVHNASRFWVGGTGTWDSSTTTHWSATTGGSNGASVPTSADAVTLDASSGGGTVTVNHATLSLTSITMGAFTGTLDFSANNNNITLQTFSGTGSGTRTFNMGNGTWTMNNGSATWNILGVTGLTFNANSSTILFSGSTSATRTFTGGAITYNNVTLNTNTLASGGLFTFNGATTITNLTINGTNYVGFQSSVTFTITTLNVVGTSSAPVMLKSSIDGGQTTLSVAANAPSINWAALRDIANAGGATWLAQNSFNLGHNNAAITITPPGNPGQIVSAQRGTPY